MGARNTSRLWYFADGTTRGGFDEYLTLQNPSDDNAHVDDATPPCGDVPPGRFPGVTPRPH
jgi:hypothetical protein